MTPWNINSQNRIDDLIAELVVLRRQLAEKEAEVERLKARTADLEEHIRQKNTTIARLSNEKAAGNLAEKQVQEQRVQIAALAAQAKERDQ